MASDDSPSLPSLSENGSSVIMLPSGSDSEPELPAASGSGQCCNSGCLAALDESPELCTRAEEVRVAFQSSRVEDLAKLRYHCLAAWQSKPSGWRHFRAWGMPLCKNAVCSLLHMGSTMYSKFTKHIAEGYIDPPMDLRRTQCQQRTTGQSTSDATVAADTLLRWIHENMAEHLAESDQFVSGKTNLLHKAETAGLADIANGPEHIKWLAPGTTLTELLSFSAAFNPEVEAPSFSTFCRIYHSDWAKWLKIRTEGQHSKCDSCEKFKAWRRLASSKSDVDMVSKLYKEHLASMMADRRVDAAIAALARQTWAGEGGDKSTLSLTLDGMDTTKFKVPRNWSCSKEWDSLWRPELRLHGALNDGYSEEYILTDQDMSKGSNLDLTIISHLLHESQGEMQKRGIPWPRFLRLHADNASNELKNQLCLKLMSWLTHRGLFQECMLTTFQVGHSHGRIDQRFSEIRAVLADSPLLQSPEDFAQALQKVKPREGRELRVKKLEAAIDFEEFFSSLQVNVSGHTQTHSKSKQGEEAVHVFFVQLRKNISKSWRDRIASSFPDTPSENDVILTCRHYLASDQDSQDPCVWVPDTRMRALQATAPDSLAPRRSLSERQAKEFSKTAVAIAKPPWNMLKASSYLSNLVKENTQGGGPHWKPLPVDWALAGHPPESSAASEPADAISPEEMQWAVRKPAAVAAKPVIKTGASKAAAKKSKAMKRPAAARSPEPVAGKRKAAEAAGSPPCGASANASDPPQPEGCEADAVSLPSPGSGEEGLHFNSALPAKPTASSATVGAPRGAVEAVPTDERPAAKEKPRKRQLGKLPMPDDAKDYLGCTKCKYSNIGCATCRRKVGLVLNADETAWTWAT
ncbi:unnamed protein product [Effrenium voratum]|uniref:DUF7869 domain-containing protein n=1 Tax=Effrenium voratum TaxID=2562239 RepID=A0AA36HK65_9DINO|nr:unnamed protein product [Effrenium voratum]